MKRLKLSSLLGCIALVLLGMPASAQYIFTTDGSWTYSSTSPLTSPATGTAIDQYSLVPSVTQGFFNSFNAAAPVTTASALWSPNSGSTSPNSCILTRTVNISLPQGKCLDQLMTLTLMIDDSCIITVNGGTPYHFGGGPLFNWALVHNISVPNDFVNGTNTIQIECFNLRQSYNWVIAKFIVDTVTCGSSGCERSICQWNTDGNFISPAANNMLGTMSNDEVRLMTSSFQRGVISTNGDFGFGTTTPTNRVHIRSQWGNASGLRLEDMPNTLPSITNPTNKVLSVDNLGNVILVDEYSGGGGSVSADNGLSLNGSSVQLGESCSNPSGAAALSDDRAIPMNFHNLVFKDPADAASSLYNRVGIGIDDCAPIAKLHVKKTSYAEEPETIGILSENISTNFHGGASIAVKGDGTGTPENNGIAIMGGYFGSRYDQYGYGVGGFNNSSEQSIGGYFSAKGNSTSNGIYATASGPGSVYAGYFNGEVFSTIGYITSDQRIKKNIRPMQHALDIINKLQPKTYAFDQSRYPSLHLPGKPVNYGLIAQELEQVLPSLVGSINVPGAEKEGKPAHMSDETLKVVNYVELIPILIQGMKEQQEAINTLKAQIARLEDGNTKPETTGNSLNVELSDLAALGQNIPNPFDHQTSIPFSIPASAQKAGIRFNGLNGNLIRTIEISERGEGRLHVSAADLSAGVYTYTLVIDNRIVDTKKMIVSHE